MSCVIYLVYYYVYSLSLGVVINFWKYPVYSIKQFMSWKHCIWIEKFSETAILNDVLKNVLSPKLQFLTVSWKMFYPGSCHSSQLSRVYWFGICRSSQYPGKICCSGSSQLVNSSVHIFSRNLSILDKYSGKIYCPRIC